MIDRGGRLFYFRAGGNDEWDDSLRHRLVITHLDVLRLLVVTGTLAVPQDDIAVQR
jgi:hypothetical protein